MITFSKIDNTPVYYWRSSRGDTSSRNWQCTQEFYDRLVLWIRDLRSLSSAYGTISYVVSAGFYVNKSGQHGAGTAVDRVEAVARHIIRKAAGAADARDEYRFLACRAEVGHGPLDRLQHGIVAATRAPANFLIAGPILGGGDFNLLVHTK